MTNFQTRLWDGEFQVELDASLTLIWFTFWNWWIWYWTIKSGLFLLIKLGMTNDLLFCWHVCDHDFYAIIFKFYRFSLKFVKKKISNLYSKIQLVFSDYLHIQLTLIVSNSVDSNFRLSRIFIEVPNFIVYKYI